MSDTVQDATQFNYEDDDDFELVDNVNTPQTSTSDDDNRTPTYEPTQKSGIFGASSNLVNSIVGAGIIGIPYALKNTGLVLGVLMLFLVAYLTDKSLRIIVEVACFHPKLRRCNVTTFEDLMSYPFGKFGRLFVLVNMFIMAYGAMVAYLLIIKDTIPTILGLAHGMNGGIEREFILVATSLTIMVPLSMQKDMASLSYTSLLSVMADTVLVVFVFLNSPIENSIENSGGVVKLMLNNSIKPTLFIGLGILSVAMACQHSSFIVYGSLENGTMKRWTTVTGYSIGISTVLCAFLGISGFMGYLDETQGDILNNFNGHTFAENGARALLAVTMFFTYPMESFVGRHVLMALMYSENGRNGPSTSSWSPSRTQKVTFVLYIATLIPALIFNDLGPVLSITGSLGGSCISYIIPGIVYLGVNGDEFISYCEDLLASYRRKKGIGEEDGSIELPVAGDANRMMFHHSEVITNGLDLPVEGHQIDMVTYPIGAKPCWWYYLGYPFWYWIAMKGSMGMKRKLSNQPRGSVNTNDSSSNDQASRDVLVTSPEDFHMAIFLTAFGIAAVIAGLGSNIYVQLHKTMSHTYSTS